MVTMIITGKMYSKLLHNEQRMVLHSGCYELDFSPVPTGRMPALRANVPNDIRGSMSSNGLQARCARPSDWRISTTFQTTYRFFISLLHVISFSSGVRIVTPTMPRMSAPRTSTAIWRRRVLLARRNSEHADIHQPVWSPLAFLRL